MTKMMKDGILILKDLFLILFFKHFHRFIFPGLALGAALGQTGVVTNAMINASAEVCLLFAISTWIIFIYLSKNTFSVKLIGFS